MRNRSLLDLASKFLHLIRFRIVFRPWRKPCRVWIARPGEFGPIPGQEVDHPLIVSSNFPPMAGPKPSSAEARFQAVKRSQLGVGLGPPD
jgi:hypothetical protein